MTDLKKSFISGPDFTEVHSFRSIRSIDPDLNPEPLGGKSEGFLCAVPSP